MTMPENTIAWCIEQDGNRDIHALFGATALRVSDRPNARERVWQYAPNGGRDDAVDYLVRKTSFLERWGGKLLGEPVEFNLSDAALATIHGTDPAEWYHAPRLYDELLAAVKPSWGAAFGSRMVTHAEWMMRQTDDWPTSWARTWDGKFV